MGSGAGMGSPGTFFRSVPSRCESWPDWKARKDVWPPPPRGDGRPWTPLPICSGGKPRWERLEAPPRLDMPPRAESWLAISAGTASGPRAVSSFGLCRKSCGLRGVARRRRRRRHRSRVA